MPDLTGSKVDTVTWLISIGHAWQAESVDHWDNPSLYPFMREVLHETVHFWQAVGTPYLLRLSCGAYRDFQEVRARAFSQDPTRPVPVDQLRLEPGYQYFSGSLRMMHRFGELSGADLIEGLARYWDIHLCGMRQALNRILDEGAATQADIAEAERLHGPFVRPDGINFTDAAVRFIFERERRYNLAYDYAMRHLGREGYILFPVLAYFALSCGKASVSTFLRWVQLFAATRPFVIAPGHFQVAWQRCYEDAFRWITETLAEPVFSPLTVYAQRRKKMLQWVLATQLPSRFGLMNAHGVLDRYMQTYWSWMRHSNPNLPREDVELRFHAAFCLPGNPIYREHLVRGFHPPVVLFEDGSSWFDTTNWGDASAHLEQNLVSFGALMGATMAVTGVFDSERLTVTCPHQTCPWHRTKLCWKVSRFPARAEECPMPDLYKSQLNFDLPHEPSWAGPERQATAPYLLVELE
jgi:hypothetical protein